MERRKVEFKDDVRGYLEATFVNEAQVMKTEIRICLFLQIEMVSCVSVNKVVRNQKTVLIYICLFIFIFSSHLILVNTFGE